MSIADGKTRVMVTFDNKVLSDLDGYCKKVGMNRSSYISLVVATALEQEKRSPMGAISNSVRDGAVK